MASTSYQFKIDQVSDCSAKVSILEYDSGPVCTCIATGSTSTSKVWRIWDYTNNTPLSRCFSCDVDTYVATISLNPNTTYNITTHFRFDNDDCNSSIFYLPDNGPVYRTITTDGAKSTFNSALNFNGVDNIKITVTAANTYVNYWSIQRSTTQFGTYTEIAQLTPSNKIYYDENIVLGQTYWYKVVAHATTSCGNNYIVNSNSSSIVAQTTIDNSCVIRNTATITNKTTGDVTSRYELWRSSTQSGTYIRCGVAYSGGTIVTDKLSLYNTAYWYKVKQVTPYWLLENTPIQYTGTLSMNTAPTLSGTVNTGTTSIDLSWTDTNVNKYQYEIYKNTNNGGYVLIATVTGNSYNAIINTNILYDFKIRGKISCFNPVFIYSPFSNEVTYSISPVIHPPIQTSPTNVTCTSTTLHWTNQNISGQTGNIVKELNGIDYDIIAYLSSGSTSYTITGQTPNTSHNYAIFAYNVGREIKSNGVNVTYLNPAPYNLIKDLDNLSCLVSYDLNDLAYGQSIRPEIRVYGQTAWTQLPTIPHNQTYYNFTNLYFSTHYEARLVRIGSEYPSQPVDFSTPVFNAPTDLIVTSIGDKQICLQWKNNSLNDGIDVYYEAESEGWVKFASVSNITTSICVTGLSMLTSYKFVVISKFGAYTLSSNQVQAITTVSFLPPFCSSENTFVVTPATCGAGNGRITMDKDYTIFYDFLLSDIEGNSYTLNEYHWDNLYANWYIISASPKPKWYFYYGNDECIVDRIKLPDSNTTISLSNTKIRNAVCGGFGNQTGRIAYSFVDTFTDDSVIYNYTFDNLDDLDITGTAGYTANIVNGTLSINTGNGGVVSIFPERNIPSPAGTYKFAINVNLINGGDNPKIALIGSSPIGFIGNLHVGYNEVVITAASDFFLTLRCSSGAGTSASFIVDNMKLINTNGGSEPSWQFTLYNTKHKEVNHQVITDISTVIYNCVSDVYFGVIENTQGCRYLIDLTEVKADKIWSVDGIQRIFLTPWSPLLQYNYYSNSDDDWYISGVDSQQYTSSKIKEFLGLQDYWYEIKLNTAVISYAQSLNKSNNGLTYNEKIDISIPRADNQKWKELSKILTQRYVIVFQDNNENWWTSFYFAGAEVKSYQLEGNQYQISFIHPSVSKMLTAIDYNYVKLNIL